MPGRCLPALRSVHAMPQDFPPRLLRSLITSLAHHIQNRANTNRRAVRRLASVWSKVAVTEGSWKRWRRPSISLSLNFSHTGEGLPAPDRTAVWGFDFTVPCGCPATAPSERF